MASHTDNERKRGLAPGLQWTRQEGAGAKPMTTPQCRVARPGGRRLPPPVRLPAQDIASRSQRVPPGQQSGPPPGVLERPFEAVPMNAFHGSARSQAVGGLRAMPGTALSFASQPSRPSAARTRPLARGESEARPAECAWSASQLPTLLTPKGGKQGGCYTPVCSPEVGVG